MTAKRIGIEDARGRLGDLVTAVQQGTDVILTRNRKPVARLIPYVEDLMDTLAPISDETMAVVANLVDYAVEAEYGDADPAANGAAMLAVASLELDLHAGYVARNGSDARLQSYARSVLAVLVREGLAARQCQCTIVAPHERDGHDHIGACTAHYEADVPELGGLRLCGTCHGAVHRAG